MNKTPHNEQQSIYILKEEVARRGATLFTYREETGIVGFEPTKCSGNIEY